MKKISLITCLALICLLVIGLFVVPVQATDSGALDTSDFSTGTIHVTFAKNNSFNISYYVDEKLSIELPTEQCYLNPGDSIYASEPEIINAKSNLFTFSKYTIRMFSDGKYCDLFETENSSGLIFTIPEDFVATEIAVFPYGKYENRSLTHRAYYLDNNKNELELYGGKWTVNNKEDAFVVNPLESYEVCYDFSEYKDSYYYVSSIPNGLLNASESTVVFPRMTSLDNTENYSVELRKYYTLEFTDPDSNVINDIANLFGANTNIIKSIKKNGKTIDKLDKSSNQELNQLKVDDMLIIRVDDQYKLIGDNKLNVGMPNHVDSEYEYRIVIPDLPVQKFNISFGKRSDNEDELFQKEIVKNATVHLYNKDESELEEGDILPADEVKMKLVIEPNAGYYISGKETKDNAFQKELLFSEYRASIKSILENHPAKPFVRIALNESSDVGTVEYTLDGVSISGTQLLREDQTIQMNFSLDPGSEFKIVKNDAVGTVVSVVTGWFSQNDSITVPIVISDKLDGTEICYKDYVVLERK